MKKILLSSFLILSILSCGNKQTKTETEIKKDSDVVVSAKDQPSIAVINTDTILEKYKLAIQARDIMTSKAEDSRLSINVKMKSLQKEMMDFQNKIENNAFLSRDRAEQEAQRLQKKEADLQSLGASLENQLMEEQQKFSLQIKDSINVAIKNINKDNKFSMVLTTSSLTDNVIYADEKLDITYEVLEFLNSRMKNKK